MSFFFNTLFKSNTEKILYAIDNNLHLEIKKLLLKEELFEDIEYYFESALRSQNTESAIAIIDAHQFNIQDFQFFVWEADFRDNESVLFKLFSLVNLVEELKTEELSLYKKVNLRLTKQKLKSKVSNF
jgi:hypothetical protein